MHDYPGRRADVIVVGSINSGCPWPTPACAAVVQLITCVYVVPQLASAGR